MNFYLYYGVKENFKKKQEHEKLHIVERGSTPRRGLQAPDPILLKLKEKMGVWGNSPKGVRAIACPFFQPSAPNR